MTTTNAPIYILGLNGLSYFLAAQLLNKGEDVILLGTPKEIKDLQKNNITIREERLLQRKKHNFTAQFEITKQPKLLIITLGAQQIKSGLLLLNPDKLSNIPIMNFAFLNNPSYLEMLLGDSLIPSYFNGYIEEDGHQISLLGRQSDILLSPDNEHKYFDDIKNIFQDTSIEISSDQGQSKYSLWKNFVQNATISLLSSNYKKTIYNLIKDKNERLLIEDCVKELSELAALENITIDVNEIVKNIYNIPNNYKTPMQLEISKHCFSEFINICEFIARKNPHQKLKNPIISSLIKDINNKILV